MKKWQRQHRIFVTLLLGIFILCGVLAVRYERAWDVSFNQRNQLSETSITIIKQLKYPVQITAFSRGNPKVKNLMNRLLMRYKRHGEFTWIFKNPDAEIDAVRQYGIKRDGEMLMTYQGQSVLISTLNETTMSRGLYRLLQGKTRHVLFASGQGERDVLSDDEQNYSRLSKRLKQTNIAINQVDLSQTKGIPNNTHVLVLAAPKHAYTDAVVKMITDYISQGGRLLWLASQTKNNEQPALSRWLGARFESGLLIGQSGKDYGLKDSSYVPIIPEKKSQIPILIGIDTLVVLPEASPIRILPTDSAKSWLAEPLLLAQGKWFLKRDNAISEAKPPLYLALSLTPKDAEKGAKVWLIGDADFASNRFIGQGQNGDFAVSVIQQLASPDTAHIVIDSEMPPPVVITEKTLAQLALALIVGVPLAILLLGFFIRRRGRL